MHLEFEFHFHKKIDECFYLNDKNNHHKVGTIVLQKNIYY